VPRSEPGALITDPDAVAAQAVRLARQGIESICVHGDNPLAVAFAGAVRHALEADGTVVAPFAGPSRP
jgi:UPF0271 protein